MRLLLVLAFVSCTLLLRAQTFPQAFTGHWKGALTWYRTGNDTPRHVQMQLLVKPADTAGQYTWQLIYGADEKDNRPYILKPIDAAKGHWLVDEQNSILLDAYWTGNKFTGVFTVEGTTILDSYWIEDGALYIEFFSYSTTPVQTSGGRDKDTPPVQSYALRSYQKAVLHKQR